MVWKKGESGNPGGRPKSLREVTELARKCGPKAIQRLSELLDSEDEKVVVAAANALLDRGYGKPTQPIAQVDKMPRDELERRAKEILKAREKMVKTLQ